MYKLCKKFKSTQLLITCLYWFSSEYHKMFGSHCHESCKIMTKNLFQIIGLLHGDTYSHTVYTRFNQDLFLIISTYQDRRQKQFFACPYFHFRFVMFFHNLRGKILQTHGSGKRTPNCCQIGFQRSRLQNKQYKKNV